MTCGLDRDDAHPHRAAVPRRARHRGAGAATALNRHVRADLDGVARSARTATRSRRGRRRQRRVRWRDGHGIETFSLRRFDRVERDGCRITLRSPTASELGSSRPTSLRQGLDDASRGVGRHSCRAAREDLSANIAVRLEGRPLPSAAVDVDRQIELLTAGAVDVISEAELRKKLETRPAAAGQARASTPPPPTSISASRSCCAGCGCSRTSATSRC